MFGTVILSNNTRSPFPEYYTTSGWWSSYSDTLRWSGITPIFDPITDLDIITEFDFLPNCERFQKNICNGCGMPTEDGLLLRTPSLVPYGICKCSFVETTDTQSYITPVYGTFPDLTFLPNLT